MKILVKVKPGSQHVSVRKLDDDHFAVSVTAVPEKGKANAAVVSALAEHFGIPRSRVILRVGHTTRNKLFEIIL